MGEASEAGHVLSVWWQMQAWLHVPSSWAAAVVCVMGVRGDPREESVLAPALCGLSSVCVCAHSPRAASCSGPVPGSGPALRGVLELCPPPSSFTQGPLRPGHSSRPVSLGGRGPAPPPRIRKAWLPQEEALDASQHIWRS